MRIDVLKFGGSSVASLQNLECVKKIINKKGNKIIVVSAFGKSGDSDIKLTDLFIECTKTNCAQDFEMIYKKVQQKIASVADVLNIKFDYVKCLKIIKKKYLKTNDKNFLISRGEYITAKILAEYLALPFIDAKDIMFFEHKKPNYKKIEKILKKITKKHKKIIIPGFYGVENKSIFIFSRGGSDITGAIISRAIKAKNYYNFTDVNGVYKISPKIIKTKTNIKKISFSDLDKLTKLGAEVIHNDCIEILKNQKIKLKICGTNKLGKGGTCVCQKAKQIWFVCVNNENIFVSGINQVDIHKLSAFCWVFDNNLNVLSIRKNIEWKKQIKTIIKLLD